MLNFGAVDYQADVYVNGMTGRYKVASHTGGHTAFTADISSRVSGNKATIYVKVIDNTDENSQPVGKQRRYPNGGGDIYYTSTSGIWQTVWMEPVEKSHITDIRTTPDVDNSKLNFDIAVSNASADGQVKVTVRDSDNVVVEQSANAGSNVSIQVQMSNPKLWSPAQPNLYKVTVTYTADGHTLDNVDSYAAMRKISYRKDDNGYWRLQLNNKDLFQFGLLDQGYWPDGLLTAPTDEALSYDIKKTKEWGFNMIRKHMKVEPARWYWHCDSLGILVWQDMPATFHSTESGWVSNKWMESDNGTQDATLDKNFRAEWKEIIDQHYSNPCIVVWTPFNECWGQYSTADIVAYTQGLDSTRLVNPASGGNHYKLGQGTIVDQHTYDQPIHMVINDPNRPLVLGEYGGLGRNISGHRWYERNSQTYNTYGGETTITDAFVTLAGQVQALAQKAEFDGNKAAYAAAVYTQTTDVETEVNGIMTYDREVVKFDETRLREAVQKLTSLYDTETGIKSLFAKDTGKCQYYNVAGMRINSPVPGLNIIRHEDGTTSKWLVKR